jgi:hypothetical protein
MKRSPKCKTELSGPEPAGEVRPSHEPKPGRREAGEAGKAVATSPGEALRADTPPAPCPHCGWSTMWNE